MMAIDQLLQQPLLLAAIPVVSAVLCAALIVVLRPLLVRYALARPNTRSSHSEPTPQGGGIAVIAATVLTVAFAGLWTHATGTYALAIVLAAAIFLALVGAMDDLRPLPVLPRLAMQVAAVTAALIVLPAQLHIAPFLPLWLERSLLLLAMLWFINLVNFMDGLDWMTVAEMLPMTVALSAFALAGWTTDVVPLALALAGALLGFAPFNRPVARLFLGDVGSLPIGLLIAWCLVQLAGQGHLVAALLLPLYYLADATITLALRLSRGEKVWEAHRTHFYQRATDNGFKVIQVVRDVFVLNILLGALAAASLILTSFEIDLLLCVTGAIAVAIVLRRFSRIKGYRLTKPLRTPK
ncbi:glycosyltransferase family 4 protein [Bradyrhizobium prioriisuperbiae]|uniref:MraY family glycosyltransferase n=1 Tax=Bradyrhizobium prioriisuperbiae TaxID=2854389 RepID=UPI0028EAB07F|nr:glycosyltransferase family 4 protein [Bradyrhizobium prioritasuperba]